MFELYAHLDKRVCPPPYTHRHGSYASHQLAEWWSINSHGVWRGGDQGPKDVFFSRDRIRFWQIVEV